MVCFDCICKELLWKSVVSVSVLLGPISPISRDEGQGGRDEMVMAILRDDYQQYASMALPEIRPFRKWNLALPCS
jgi:hypothetical protein